MFSPGDVIGFWSEEAGKRKYHLCISLDGHFLFVNSPKSRTFPGDFIVPCTDFPFLPPTTTNESIISCSTVLRKSDAALNRFKAEKLGTISNSLLRRLLDFIEHSTVLSDEDKEAVLDGLGDWI